MIRHAADLMHKYLVALTNTGHISPSRSQPVFGNQFPPLFCAEDNVHKRLNKRVRHVFAPRTIIFTKRVHCACAAPTALVIANRRPTASPWAKLASRRWRSISGLPLGEVYSHIVRLFAKTKNKYIPLPRLRCKLTCRRGYGDKDPLTPAERIKKV